MEERDAFDIAQTIKTNPLEHFLDRTFVKDFMQQRLINMNLSDFELSNCEINQLRSKRRKPAIQFDLYLHNKKYDYFLAPKSMVGKWSSDELGSDVFDLIQELWHKGFDGEEDAQNNDDGRLKICEPITYFSDYDFMLTSKASGVQLGKILKQNDAALLERSVIQAASWLSKLHRTRTNRTNSYSLQVEEEKLKEYSEHLDSLYPSFADRMRKMLSVILDKERSLDTKRFTLIHGDFNLNNIFVDGSDLTVIDFEDSCIFDACKDLGYFIAKLLSAKRKYNLSVDVESLEKRFLDKYVTKSSLSPELSIDPLERVALYKARSYLKHLHSRYWTGRRKRMPDRTDCEYWLDQVEECLKSQ